LPLLERAYDVALAAGEHFIATDAAHSCALAGDMVMWTKRGLDLAERHEGAAYWKGTLLMNLGDWQFDRGEYVPSLASFRAALLEARAEDGRHPQLREYALRHRPRSPRARQAVGGRSTPRTGGGLDGRVGS
jgi:hypothetical protein